MEVDTVQLSTQDSDYGKVLADFGPNGLVLASQSQALNVSELHQLSLMHSVDRPFMKSFVVTSCDVFCEVQKLYNAYYPQPVPQSKIANMSRRYRAILIELVKAFEDSSDRDAATLYFNLNFVWSFCEIAFIASNPDLPVLPYYIEWIQENYDDSKVVVSNLDDNMKDMDGDVMETMWAVIKKLVFHGKTAEAAEHLKYMNPRNLPSLAEQIESLNEILLKRPVFSPSVHSVSNFEQAWLAWQKELQNRVDHKLYADNENLTFLAKVMLGDDEAFEEARLQIPTWYEYLGMFLCYRNPTATPASLKTLAIFVLEFYGITNISVLTPLEHVLLQAMDFDILAVLRDMQRHWNHPWFTLHFADLVFCGGKCPNIKEIQLVFGSVGLLREEFIMDYGITLMQHASMWQIGAKYLEAIPERGGWPIIKECLKRKYAHTDFEAQKVISVAEKYGFSEEVHDICKIRALKKLREGRKQDALSWSVKAGDGPLITHILDDLLLQENYDIDQSLLESIRNSLPYADRLWFLSGFCEFRKMMARQDFKSAVAQLCHLISEDLIPERMSAKIALNIQHFRTREAVMDASQVSCLMQYLATKVNIEEIGDDMFRKLNSVLLCISADVAVKSLKRARQAAIGCA